MLPEKIDTETLDEVAEAPSRSVPVVILDSGDAARLRLWYGAEPPTVGTRFRDRQSTWVITGYRAHARAFVAEPVPH